MSRKEEIQQASFEYHSKPYLGAIKDDFVNGAEWADRTMLNKVCEWVKDNGNSYIEIKDGQLQLRKWIVNDLRKAMGG